jgi:hypothetical protein
VVRRLATLYPERADAEAGRGQAKPCTRFTH